MRQQINLYQEVLIDKPQPLQSRQAGAILLAVVCCLGLLFAYSFYKTKIHAAQLEELHHNNSLAGAQLALLQERYPEPQKSVLLEEKIRRLEREIENIRTKLKFFGQHDDKSNAAIRESLEGLAKHPFPGLWLRHIRIYSGGKEVQLRGSAVRADRVPDYVALLSEKLIFGGKPFSRLKVELIEEHEVEKSADTHGWVDFVLESGLEKAQ